MKYAAAAATKAPAVTKTSVQVLAASEQSAAP